MGISVGLSERTKILIALIAAALLLTGCAVFREQIAGLILSFGDGFVSVEGNVDPDAPREIEHAYVATYIPDGFVEAERVEEWYEVETVWKNADGEQIYLLQWTVDGAIFGADTKYSEYSKIELEHFDVFVIEGDGYSVLYWSDGSYVFKLRASFNLNKESAIDIISSLK